MQRRPDPRDGGTATSLLVLLPRSALRAPPGDHARDAADRLIPAFRALGVRTVTADLDRIRLEDGVVRAARFDGPETEPASFDRAMLLGFGARASTLDRMQLLEASGARWVTAPAVLVMHHAKYGGDRVQRTFPVPRTLAGSGRFLAARLRALPPGDRLVKPPAGSFGLDVAALHRDPERAADVLEAAGDAFRVVQDRVRGREVRVLLAAGSVVGAYARVPASGPAANRARGGGAEPFVPDGPLAARLEALAAELAAAGIGWAGVDLKGEHLLEVNLVNPGGLGTLAALGDHGAAERAARALLGPSCGTGRAEHDPAPPERSFP